MWRNVDLAPDANGFVYPEMAWDPEHLSMVLLADFVQVPDQVPAPAPLWWTTFTAGLTLQLPDHDHNDLELRELTHLIEYRSGDIREALAQRSNIAKYYQGILSFTRFTHPYTVYLINAAVRIGQFQAMHYKRIFDRPRPSHLSPSLMPPFYVPGHASFPSGHATQAYLVTACLKQVMASAGASVQEALDRMAIRIARNREHCGLHTRSESVAGEYLATQTFLILQQMATVPNSRMKRIVDEATKEWLRWTPSTYF
jgi:hypothetical protein